MVGHVLRQTGVAVQSVRQQEPPPHAGPVPGRPPGDGAKSFLVVTGAGAGSRLLLFGAGGVLFELVRKSREERVAVPM